MKQDSNLDNLYGQPSEAEEELRYDAKLPKETILFILQRDNFMCVNCNSDYNLSIHHIIFRSISRDHHPDNLLTLCASCHRLMHDGKMQIRRINGNWFFGKTK